AKASLVPKEIGAESTRLLRGVECTGKIGAAGLIEPRAGFGRHVGGEEGLDVLRRRDGSVLAFELAGEAQPWRAPFREDDVRGAAVERLDDERFEAGGAGPRRRSRTRRGTARPARPAPPTL